MLLIGVDEAGRGPLAGPVVAAAVIIDRKNTIEGIKDSKKLSYKARESLYEEITGNYKWAVGIVSPLEIDEININGASKKAYNIAVNGLNIADDAIVLVDGNMKFANSNFVSIIKGDDLLTAISAASIVAKVTRDRLMRGLSESFPQYLWHKNSGYGTAEHIKAIRQFGLSAHHRKTFNSAFLD